MIVILAHKVQQVVLFIDQTVEKLHTHLQTLLSLVVHWAWVHGAVHLNFAEIVWGERVGQGWVRFGTACQETPEV